MVFQSYKRFLLLHCCWSLTMASDKFNEIKIQRLEGNVLRISCGIISGASDSLPMQMSIFADTTDNTLVSVDFTKCPQIQESAKDKHIYLPKCVPNKENIFLDILLINYNSTGNQQFGCNYEYVYLVGTRQILNSLSLAAVTSPDNSSPGTSNQTQSTSATTPEECHEAKEGTSSSIKRDDKSIVDHGETCGRHDSLTLALSFIAAITSVLLLLITVYKKSWIINCRHCLSPCGKTDQAKCKTLECSKHDEHDDSYMYTTINKRKKLDNSDDCTVVHADNSSENVNDMCVRIK